MQEEITDERLERQDFVDNAIFSLLQEINPTSQTMSWDIEMIGNIRDVIVRELAKKLGITETEIYL